MTIFSIAAITRAFGLTKAMARLHTPLVQTNGNIYIEIANTHLV